MTRLLLVEEYHLKARLIAVLVMPVNAKSERRADAKKMAEKPVPRAYSVAADQGPNSDGGESGGGSLEARVSALEDKFERIDAKLDGLGRDMKSMTSDLAYLKGRVDSMPSTLQLLGFVLAVLGIAGLAKYFAI